ncbi:MAG: polysaccharide pyruvyl transferase CsaB [Candidatus Fervidibacter sp.]|uniref:polysaccharide pyruvyl transferase CsaB n=1 Tax=Candidatus Fervidibacter sp. TaxID=3100871 RepID=UPI00404B2539
MRKSKGSNAHLVFGYFGAGNFGDEWTLASFLEGCSQCGFEPKNFIVLSRNPKRTTEEHNVHAIPGDWRVIFSTLKNCQWVIGCGGSLLQDVTSFRSLAFYCLLVWVAKAMGKSVALLGQGLGPLKRPLSKKLAMHTLNACDLVTFREPISFEAARSLGVSTDKCFVTADLTFTWDKFPKAEQKAAVGVNLRPIKGHWSGKAIEEMLKTSFSGERILLLPLQPNGDESALKPLTNLTNTDWWRCETWLDGLAGIASVNLLIAMRLHALIAACLLGIPFLALNYDPKVENILQGVASQWIFPLSVNSNELNEAIQRIRSEFLETVRSRLIEFSAAQRLEARRNFELFVERLVA